MIERAALLAVVLTAGCSGSSPSPADPDDAGREAPRPVSSSPPAPAPEAPADATIAITVEWKDAPAALLREGPLDSCSRPRRPRLQVHSTGGVPGALVVLDTPAASPASSTPLVIVRDCRLADRLVAVPGEPWAFEIKSRDQREHSGRVVRAGKAPVPVPLRVYGQRLLVSGEGEGWLTFELDGAPAGYLYAVGERAHQRTDARGVARFTGLRPGRYTGRVLYPPMAEDGEGVAVGFDVEVRAGAVASPTVSLAP